MELQKPLKVFMQSKSNPRLNPHREYESPVHIYRVSAGLTLKELHKSSKVDPGTICALANGTLSPIKEDGSGRLRSSAKRLCEFFKVGPEEMFPRYICSIERAHKFDIQVNSSWSEYYASLYGDSMIDRLFARDLITSGLINESIRNRKIFTMRLYGASLDEIGEEFGFTRERVRQIYERCIRKIRSIAAAKGFTVAPIHSFWSKTR